MSNLTRKQLLALDNMSLLMKASRDGLQVFPEDLHVNYAEIDLELSKLEQDWAERITHRMLDILIQYAKDLETDKNKVAEESGLSSAFSSLFMEFVRSVWAYGQGTADNELKQLETFAEGSGVGVQGSTLTNDDAFEWYQLYAKELGKHQETSVFHYMQPIILEHLDRGTVGTELAEDLAASFAQYGPVRAAIIARTESNKAFNWGRRYRFDQSAAIAGYRYSAILDERTTEICRTLHGHSWKIDDPELDLVTPCNHYQCRSILVPISKYVSHDWKSPAAGWEKDLPDKEREVFERFKDSAFYPKAETVKAGKAPKMAAPKKQADPGPKKKTKKKADPAPAPVTAKEWKGPKDVTAAADQMLTFSHGKTIRDIQRFIDSNVKNGISKDHPGLKAAAALIDDINNGIYDGKMITGSYNSRKKAYEIHDYIRMNNVFWRVATSSITATERRRMLQEIEQISTDPLFAGVKIDLIKSKTVYGSYNIGSDILQYTPEASQSIKRTQVQGGELGTLWHEIGHRVHGVNALYKTEYVEELAALDLSMSDELWGQWEKLTDPYWEGSFTQKGSKFLPSDLHDRYDYPINAAYYYDKGTKSNFHKEMFAETTSVYLENNANEIEKVSRTYPGLLEFLENLYKRDHIKKG